MPFQVTFSQKAIPAGIIQAIDAGTDGIAVCDLSFTLTAQVIGDLQGHTVSWEQIEGDPVTFTTPTDQLTISYTQTTFDDKRFRFYVDRGTAFELFDDVNVYGSPTDNLYQVFKIDARMIDLNSTTSTRGEELILKVASSMPMVPFEEAANVNTYNVANASLTWTKPRTEHKVMGYIIRERNNTSGVWNDIGSVGPDVNFFTNVQAGFSYQVATIFLFNNSHLGQRGSNVVWVSGDFQKTTPIIEANDVISFEATIDPENIVGYDYDVEKLVIVAHNPSFEDHYFRVGAVSQDNIVVYDYDVEKLSIIVHLPPYDSIYSALPTITQRTISVFDYDVTVQTGGQIGG